MFLIGICVFLAFLIVNITDVEEAFSDYPDAIDVLDKGKAAVLTADNLFLFILVGLSIFVIIGAAIIYNHPAYFVLGFFALAISLVFAAIISNTFWSFYSSSSSMLTASASFPKIVFLMNNLPFYLLFMGLASLIASIVGYRRT